jgi:ketosteroid isomerase-like protein
MNIGSLTALVRTSSILSPLMLVLTGCTAPPSPDPHGEAHSASTNELLARIARLDSAMFSAFNAHDADRLGTFFSPDLEFYHDKSGLAGYDTTMANFRALFERNRDTGMRRDLVAGSLEVYPLGEFGALEVCLHRFCHKENGKDDCGTFKNIMVWKHDGDAWKVTRVISYDH